MPGYGQLKFSEQVFKNKILGGELALTEFRVRANDLLAQHGIPEGEANRQEIMIRWMMQNQEELLNIDKQLKKSGLTLDEQQVQRQEIMLRMLKKDETWQEAEKWFGVIGTLTGGFARGATGAFMLERLGGTR